MSPTILVPNGKILVLPRRLAQDFTHNAPWACISIHDSEDPPAKINKCQLVDKLVLSFDDIPWQDDVLVPFNEVHANQVLDFVYKFWDKIELLLIHCYAGASRSPAIAAIVSKIYYGEDHYYFKNYTPNNLVYQVLYKTAVKRGWEP